MLSSESEYLKGLDSNLFFLVQQNDIKAFEELYKRYWPMLVNAAYKRLNSKEKSEDLVQNIFIDIYQRRTKIKINNSLKAYLYQALKFRMLNVYRSEMISNKYKRYKFFSPFCKNDLANELEARELETIINHTLNLLPEKCKEVFLLSRKENLSNRDVSIKLNITISTVEKHISKALKILKSSLN